VEAEVNVGAETVKVGEPGDAALYQKLTVLEPSLITTEVTLVIPASE
jgi:hypothetical protein